MNKFMKIAALVLACCTVVSFSGCTGSKDSDNKNTTLTWYFPADETEEDADVYAAANKIIDEKLGVTVDFQPINIGDYTQKMQLKSSANEKFDLCFTAAWAFTYHTNAAKGAFLKLDELIDKYAPKTKKLIPENIWNGTKLDGSFYAVPNYQIETMHRCFLFNKKLVDQYGLKEQIDAAQSMVDFTDVLQVIKDNEPDIYPTEIHPVTTAWGREEFIEEPISGVPVGVDMDLNVLDLREGRYRDWQLQMEEVSKEWNKRGFYSPDVAIVSNTESERKAGKYFMIYDTYKPGIETDMADRYGYEMYAKPLGDAYIANSTIQAALTAISRTCAQPEKAMEVIELINTDKELLNTLVYGNEGKQYTKTGENSIEKIEGSVYSAVAWCFGNQFLAYTLPGQTEDVWELTEKANEEAFTAPLTGFMLDEETIKTEKSNIKTILNPYSRSLKFGLVDNNLEIHQQQDRDMDQDMQKILEEVKRQVEEFKLSKNK